MSNLKCTSLRFNLDKPLDRQAWEYLQNMDKDEFKSYSQAVALAVTEYFKRYYQRVNDPYFETREREERLSSRSLWELRQLLKKLCQHFWRLALLK